VRAGAGPGPGEKERVPIEELLASLAGDLLCFPSAAGHDGMKTEAMLAPGCRAEGE
jgi:hypothetical protein